MVFELKSYSDFREYISRNRLAMLAITNRDRENLWNYIIQIFKDLEQMARPSISFAIIHYQAITDLLKPFELDQAKKSVIIKLYLNSENVFEQEGIMGSKYNDEITLKKGIRESLKLYSIDVKFVSI